jgi:dolichol-phosphate mannosyltransferase
MRIAVAGAAGFVGSNLARALVASGHDVHCFVRPQSDTWRLRGVAAMVWEVDLERREQIDEHLGRLRPDALVDAAAHGAYAHQTDIERMISVNFRAVGSFVDWCRQHDIPLLHLGSSAEYGHLSAAPHETARIAPNSMYAVTKAAGTHLLCDAVERGELLGVTFRLYSVYGPWEEPTRLMPTIASCALDGRLPPQLVDPDVAHDFVHVDDVVRAVASWIENPIRVGSPAVVNIGSGTQTSLADLVTIVQDRLGVSDRPGWGTMPRRHWDRSTWRADTRRARTSLGWAPSVALADGIEHLVRFVAEHPDRYVV